MKRLAVVGDPVAHSRSPAMQSAALAALGLEQEWSYEAVEIPPADFAGLVRAMPDEGFVGVNVTIPHKQAALALADTASAAATEIGAANTLSFSPSGIHADNTDAPGLIAALPGPPPGVRALVLGAGGPARAAATEIGAANTLSFSPSGIHADNTDALGLIAALPGPPSGMRALVLGAGGSARAAAWALAGQGAIVEVWNRTPERADELVRDLARSVAEAADDEPRLAPVSDRQARAGTHGLIVNCTAVGLQGPEEEPFEQLPIAPSRLGPEVTVVDLVYGVGETVLVAEARRRGAAVVDGLEVLVRQGAESLRIWTGLEAPLDVMREAARKG